MILTMINNDKTNEKNGGFREFTTGDDTLGVTRFSGDHTA